MMRGKFLFRKKSEQELFDQLEQIKCRKLVETINYVLKILGDMESDNYKFTPRTYQANLDQLLSERWIRSEDLQNLMKPDFLYKITNPFARRILNVDITVIKKIGSYLVQINNILDLSKDSSKMPLTLLSEKEQEAIRDLAKKINDQCWKFFRAVKLFESAKILLRAIQEHEEFSRDPEGFKEKNENMYIPIVVHE